jgi:hypothetical protein
MVLTRGRVGRKSEPVFTERTVQDPICLYITPLDFDMRQYHFKNKIVLCDEWYSIELKFLTVCLIADIHAHMQFFTMTFQSDQTPNCPNCQPQAVTLGMEGLAGGKSDKVLQQGYNSYLCEKKKSRCVLALALPVQVKTTTKLQTRTYTNTHQFRPHCEHCWIKKGYLVTHRKGGAWWRTCISVSRGWYTSDRSPYLSVPHRWKTGK